MLRALLALALLASLPACGLLSFDRERIEIEATLVWLSGTVRRERPTAAPVVVLVLEVRDGQQIALTSRQVIYGDDPYRILERSGELVIAAFEDTNENLVLESGERWGFHADGKVIHPTQDSDGLEVPIPAAARPLDEAPFEIAGLDAGGEHLLPNAVGVVVELDDPALSREAGRLGLEQPQRYLETVRAGVYFLGEYDPRKTPVLMIHGIGGSPVDFRTIIEGSPESGGEPGFPGLDGSRFQPWLVSYPSSFPLAIVADAIQSWVNLLRTKHAPERIHLVAHSMGGLVARAFIGEQAARGRADVLGCFVSIATPWGGNPAARLGVALSPIVIWSWRDVATGSPFLAGLFETPLPEHLGFHLIFPYPPRKAEDGALPSGDGVIGFNSLVHPDAFREAASVTVLEGEHVSILRSPELVARLGVILGTSGGGRQAAKW